MPTVNQLIRKSRKKIVNKSASRALEKSPQKRVYVLVFILLLLRSLILRLEK